MPGADGGSLIRLVVFWASWWALVMWLEHCLTRHLLTRDLEVLRFVRSGIGSVIVTLAIIGMLAIGMIFAEHLFGSELLLMHDMAWLYGGLPVVLFSLPFLIRQKRDVDGRLHLLDRSP